MTKIYATCLHIVTFLMALAYWVNINVALFITPLPAPFSKEELSAFLTHALLGGILLVFVIANHAVQRHIKETRAQQTQKEKQDTSVPCSVISLATERKRRTPRQKQPVEKSVDKKEGIYKARHSVAQELHDESPEENPNG